MSIQFIPLELLDPHPDNPRLQLRDGIIQAIRAQLERAPYDEIHAIVVRPIGDRFQIVDGHHRVESARGANLLAIPAWVREYTDEEAYMQMALANAQSGLTSLERGHHAHLATTKYGKNGRASIAAYAKAVVRTESTVFNEVYAWEVYEFLHMEELQTYFRHLAAIHAADS